MNARKLLVLDASFSYEMIVDRGLESTVTCRDLDGYFEHVWSVHPFASLVNTAAWDRRFGSPTVFNMSERHTFIEGKVGAFAFLGKFPAINFLLSQLHMFVYLFRLIGKENISVIRVGDALYLGLLGLILSKSRRIPIVVRVGANNERIRITTNRAIMPKLFRFKWLERQIEQFFFRRADLVAGVNSDNLSYAIDSGADPEKCTIFRYGNLINAAHFQEPAKRPLPDNFGIAHPFLLCISRLELVKKVDDVVRVLAFVRDCGFEVQAYLVGDGAERENIKNLAFELGVADHLIFFGNKDQLWLSAMIPRAAVVLSPCTGRALTEAALGAAPVVAYDIDWQSEMIESGSTGELVPFGDWQSMAAAVVKLLGDPPYSQTLGANLRALTLEMMNPINLDNHERQQYSELLQS